MKKQLLILTVLLSLITNAQIIFEKGYYITNDDQKIDCFIKNNDWKYNNRYGIELRYHSNRELLKNYSSWSSDYKTVSFIIGYSFL